QGLVDAPGFWESPERYFRTDWQGPPRPWIDPLKEAKAEEIALKLKLTTRGRILNRHGYDLRSTFEEIAAEHALAEKYGITLPEMETDADDDVKPNLRLTAGEDGEAA
ncbi:MAG: hypothetical protein KC983_10875, partial [Phycisphaerales bacterium]|nr:hypothetical protein [Phycisphaerales bacterium]